MKEELKDEVQDAKRGCLESIPIIGTILYFKNGYAKDDMKTAKVGINQMKRGVKVAKNVGNGIFYVIFYDFLCYDYFSGFGCLGVILWLICLPIIIVIAIIRFVLNSIFD